jgi:hypothetical protein
MIAALIIAMADYSREFGAGKNRRAAGQSIITITASANEHYRKCVFSYCGKNSDTIEFVLARPVRVIDSTARSLDNTCALIRKETKGGRLITKTRFNLVTFL